MNQKHSCPNCNQTDNVRKVSAIYSEGTATTSASVRHSEGGYSYGSGTAQTSLSRKLSPPEQPQEFSVIIKALAWIFSLLPLWGAVSFTKIYFESVAAGNNNTMMIVGAILLAGFGIFLISQIFQEGKRYQTKLERWERVKPKWDKLYYCSRCDGVFTLDKNKFISVDQIDVYLK